MRPARSFLGDFPTPDGVRNSSREQPSFDMTRQGFVLLAMGWAGQRASLAVGPARSVRRKSS